MTNFDLHTQNSLPTGKREGTPFLHFTHLLTTVRSLVAWILLTSLLCLAPLGCNSSFVKEKDNDSGGSSSSGGFDVQKLSANTNGSGQANVSFQVPDGSSKFSIVAELDGAVVSFRSLSNNSGADFLTPGGELTSLAIEPFPTLSTATVPPRDFDPSIQNGQNFSATALVNRGSGQSVNFTVQSRTDSDLRNGSLDVNVFYVSAITQTDTVKNAVEKGLGTMENIYQSQAGISFGKLSEFDISGPILLPDPTVGDNLYLGATSGAPTPAINIFVGADIAASEGTLLGFAAGIPGPGLPSKRSAVAISILGHTGVTGDFTDDVISLLGETIAHESAHYIGLFHPAEIQNSGTPVTEFDPLPDTETCPSYQACVANQSLVHNLMFPISMVGSDGKFVTQDQLTSQQRGVLNLYIAVD